jgi:inorganic phosphate transporter, PiT family
VNILILFLAALLLAYANGANDNFKATATVYGAGVLSYQRALALATTAQVAGSLASVALAGALIKAFSGKGLVPAAVVADPRFLIAVGVGAAATVLIATRVGLPISTTHALIGGLIGGGLAFARSDLAWGGLGKAFFLPLLISPMLALGAAAILYPILRRIRLYLGVEASTCLCIRCAPAKGEWPALAHVGTDLGADTVRDCTRQYEGCVLGVSAQTVASALHGLSAFSLGFARGLNDTPKVLGLLLAAGVLGAHTGATLTAIAVAMALGGVLHSRKLANALGKNITPLNHGQGLLANLVASSLVIGASLLGSPVSTTHVSTGAIFGIGTWTGRADWRLVTGIVLAWIGTLPLGAALAGGLGILLQSV